MFTKRGGGDGRNRAFDIAAQLSVDILGWSDVSDETKALKRHHVLEQIGQAVRGPTARWAPVSKELLAYLDQALVVKQRRSAPKYQVALKIQSLACLMCLIPGSKIDEL